MGLFKEKDPYKIELDVFSLQPYVNKKKRILYISLSILIVIASCVAIYYIVNTIQVNEKKQKYEAQIMEYVTEQEEIKKQDEEKQKARLAKIPKLTDEGKENIKHVYSSETKRAFLTFDDGPSENTEQILNILKENNIKATFFVLGAMVERMPEMARRIYDEGHYLANHGDTHVYSRIYTSKEEVLNEFNRCNEKVANAIGIAEFNSHLFRFPGGSIGGPYADLKQEAIGLLEQNEILHVDWNALTGDAETQNPTEEYLMNNLVTTTQDKNSVVILMHDAQAKVQTVYTLPKVIDYLKQQGYEFQSFYSIIK